MLKARTIRSTKTFPRASRGGRCDRRTVGALPVVAFAGAAIIGERGMGFQSKNPCHRTLMVTGVLQWPKRPVSSHQRARTRYSPASLNTYAGLSTARLASNCVCQ
jgi:hypothetical protein